MDSHNLHDKQRQRGFLSDNEIEHEMRKMSLRRGSDENWLVTLGRPLLFAVCLLATIFLIFKTLYSPAIKGAKLPVAGISKNVE